MGEGLAALSGAFAAVLAASGAAAPQSLTEALAEAYRTNPQLLAQRALLRATDEMVPQALAGWRPTVAFSGQIGFSRSASVAPQTAREIGRASCRERVCYVV